MTFVYCPPKDLQDLKSETFPDGRRYYTLEDGTKLPSVTTVLGAQKKQAIMEWRKRVGEETANKISRQATRRGTNVHTLCERYLNNDGTQTSPSNYNYYYPQALFHMNGGIELNF